MRDDLISLDGHLDCRVSGYKRPLALQGSASAATLRSLALADADPRCAREDQSR